MDEQEYIGRCQAGDARSFEPVFRNHVHTVKSRLYVARQRVSARLGGQEEDIVP